ncbi:MAG TPA: hypothetical protein VND45_01515 [Thermoanaerobaculia bacterium]|nr:hypothetical protein [Thermoanaerobaculia bacterium]
MNVLTAYRSLSAEQQRALREKRLEVNRPIGPLLDFLRPLAACDAMSDKARTKLGCTFALSLGVLIFAAIFFASLWTTTATLVVGALSVLMLLSGFFWRWTRSIDVSNNVRQFLLPVLTVLREDFDPQSPVHVRVDLSAPTAPAKKRGESAPYAKGGYYKVIDTTYVDDWVALDGILVDGTKLSWNVSDSIRERRKTKRNARGKHKTKTSHKKKSNIEVSMALRKKTYVLTATEGEVSGDEKRHSVRLTREVVTASLDPLDPRALLDLVADVFRSARPAKEGGA